MYWLMNFQYLFTKQWYETIYLDHYHIQLMRAIRVVQVVMLVPQ